LKKTDLKDTKLNNQCQKFAKFEEKKSSDIMWKKISGGEKKKYARL
jgi:hypothetical protein